MKKKVIELDKCDLDIIIDLLNHEAENCCDCGSDDPDSEYHEYYKDIHRILDTLEENDQSDNRFDDRLPSTYCEIEYEDMESAEAILGSRWDDMNYLHYMER